MFMTEIPLPAADGTMRVAMAGPDGRGPHPAVLVAHHREGLDDFTRYVLMRLAEIGLIAAAPDFYHRRPPGEDPIASMKHLKDGEIVADIAVAAAHLQGLPTVRADRIGTV